MSYGRRIEPIWLELTQQSISIPDLHDAHDGLRIVHLTDFHGGARVPMSYLRHCVRLANEQAPDVVALTGDFIHRGFRYVDRVAQTLGQLKAPHGVFAVLGNHDFSVRTALGFRRYRLLHQRMASALESEGIQLLRNRAFPISFNGVELHLAGVDDLWSGTCDLDAALAQVPDASPRLVLAHNPRTIERLDGRRCDLMLSGHTHGGQINLPRYGRVLLTRKNRRFAAGMYRVSDSQLYVNRGVGYGFRFRYGVRPEVAVIELRKSS